MEPSSSSSSTPSETAATTTASAATTQLTVTAPIPIPAQALTRKRLLSLGEGDGPTTASAGPILRKRPRMSSMSMSMSMSMNMSAFRGHAHTHGLGSATVNPSPLDRLPRTRPIHTSDELDLSTLSHPLHPSLSHPRPLSSSSSFTSASRACSPEGDTLISRSGMALMRSVSSASLTASTPPPPTYPECSAKYHLRQHPKFMLDFSVPSSSSPSSSPENESTGIWGLGNLISVSQDSVLFFSRGNRVYYKSLLGSGSGSGEEVGQLCRLQESHGDLRVIVCSLASPPDASASASGSGGEVGTGAGLIALGTSKGIVQIYDARTRKRLLTWSVRSLSAMAFSPGGGTLSIGGEKGTIWHFDLRLCLPSSSSSSSNGAGAASGSGAGLGGAGGVGEGGQGVEKMKEQVRKVTRHQARILCLEWNVDGRILASGDASGVVYCWDHAEGGVGNANTNSRGRVPMDVGEFVQRRKKIQHKGAISALAFSPWQPRLLATASLDGVMHLWNINPLVQHSNAASSTAMLDLGRGAPITSVAFSPWCKEIVTTQGWAAAPTPPSGGPEGRGSGREGGRTRTTSVSISTRSPQVQPPTTPPIEVRNEESEYANCIAVHAFPSLRPVTKLSIATSNANNAGGARRGSNVAGGGNGKMSIGGSVLVGGGTRIVVGVGLASSASLSSNEDGGENNAAAAAVEAEGTGTGEGRGAGERRAGTGLGLGMCEIWARRKEVKRQVSFLGATIR